MGLLSALLKSGSVYFITEYLPLKGIVATHYYIYALLLIIEILVAGGIYAMSIVITIAKLVFVYFASYQTEKYIHPFITDDSDRVAVTKWIPLVIYALIELIF